MQLFTYRKDTDRRWTSWPRWSTTKYGGGASSLTTFHPYKPHLFPYHPELFHLISDYRSPKVHRHRPTRRMLQVKLSPPQVIPQKIRLHILVSTLLSTRVCSMSMTTDKAISTDRYVVPTYSTWDDARDNWQAHMATQKQYGRIVLSSSNRRSKPRYQVQIGKDKSLKADSYLLLVGLAIKKGYIIIDRTYVLICESVYLWGIVGLPVLSFSSQNLALRNERRRLLFRLRQTLIQLQLLQPILQNKQHLPPLCPIQTLRRRSRRRNLHLPSRLQSLRPKPQFPLPPRLRHRFKRKHL